jgi:ABC-2 type transport system permease protein
MQRLNSIFRLGLKELVSLGRDVAMVGLIVYAFTYAVFGPAKGAQMELRNAAVAIVDEDRSPLSARIADALLPPFFKPPQYGLGEIDARWTPAATPLSSTFRRASGRPRGGPPPDRPAQRGCHSMSQAGRGAGYIAAIIGEEVQRFTGADKAPEPVVRLVTRAKFNPNLQDTWFIAVSQIINNITMLAIILSGAAVVREREHGTIEHLLVLPLHPSDIMLAKIWSSALVIAVVATLCCASSVGMLEVPIAGSVALFMAGTVLYMFSISSLSIFLATIARSMPQFGLLAIPVFLVLNMLSGGTTPLDSMPQWLRNTLQFSPAAHFVSLSMAILYRGAGFMDVWDTSQRWLRRRGILCRRARRFRKTVTVLQS